MSQSNLLQEIDEELQRQKAEKLWKQYGKYVIAGAVAIVLITAAIVGWKNYRLQVETKVTSELLTILSSKDEISKKIEGLEKFSAGNHGESQATFATLHAAGLAAKTGDMAKAVALYDALADDGKADKFYRQLADLLAVQTQFDTEDADKLQQRLQPLLDDDCSWRYSAKELSGHLAMKKGDLEKAKQFFTELSTDQNAPPAIARRAADMLPVVSVEK